APRGRIAVEVLRLAAVARVLPVAALVLLPTVASVPVDVAIAARIDVVADAHRRAAGTGDRTDARGLPRPGVCHHALGGRNLPSGSGVSVRPSAPRRDGAGLRVPRHAARARRVLSRVHVADAGALASRGGAGARVVAAAGLRRPAVPGP